ncbi:hypothetical protein BDV18DRAFT_166522 [Aspergillus unguis]
MDLLKQRLTFGCMWAFEDIGVRELEAELLVKYPQLDCHCEYSREEDVLVVKGKLGGYNATITAMISSFIEKQKSKDLLDTPRLRVLDLPSVVRNHPSIVASVDKHQTEALLPLDDDTEKLIPHPRTKISKFWLSSTGGVGCFSRNANKEILGEVAYCTGTEINLVDDFKGIQVSGGSENDVDDALTRLSQIERPLSLLNNPQISNLSIGKTESGTRFGIQPYHQLNPVAVRRVLADPSLTANAGLGQMFVTSLYSYNEDTQKYSPPKNLTELQLCSRENGDSRSWNGFVYQEVGKGDSFVAIMEPAVESDSETQTVPSELAACHPFLSLDKAKQVTEWIVEKSSTEVADMARRMEGVPNPSSRPRTPSRPPGADEKQVPGIKKRRPAVQNPQPETARVKRSTTPEATPIKPQVESKDKTITPRKRWNMTYKQEINSPPKHRNLATEIEDTVKNSNPVLDQTVTSNTQLVKGTSYLPVKFDPTSYGHNKKLPQTIRPGTGSIKAQTSGRIPPFLNGKPPIRQPAGPSSKKNELVDVITPVETISSVHPPLTHDTLALIPEQPAPLANSNYADLAGLEFGAKDGSDRSTTASSSWHDGSKSRAISPSSQAARLERLKSTYQNLQASVAKPSFKPAKRPGPADRHKQLVEQALKDRGRSSQSEAEKSDDETTSRQYHRTMGQRMAKSDQKAKNKLAKRQATLEDAWGTPNPKKPVKDSSSQNVPRNPLFAGATPSEKLQKQKAATDDDTGRLFAAIRPILEAAESFPGVLTLEIQFGLIVVPVLPKTLNLGLMSSNEWSKLLQPRTGATPPSTKFLNRLTTCGSEVDHVVDLKTSKADGKSRMFQETYAEYNVSYDFHCRTRKEEMFVISIDEQGRYTIQCPKSALGAVNMHFPSRIWDARALIEAARQYRPGSRPELEETAKFITEHLWIPAENIIRIHTSLPKGSKVTIEKVFMRRWTRHRHLRADNSKCGDNATNEDQNVFLQVTEVQDLFIGIGTQASSENQHIRARFTTSEEMVRMGKVWYELSLVSSDLEAIFRTNAALEVGDRTEDWRAADLCGSPATDSTEQVEYPQTHLAGQVGSGNLAEMFKVAKSVVGKMDGVGACNRGPLGPEMALAVGNLPQAKGWDHDEIESVKEVESVIARVNDRPFDAEAFKREQAELDYW